MKQVAQRNFRWWAAVKREEEEEEGWLHARVHVKHSGWTSTAAAESLPTRRHASRHSIRPFLRGLVQGLIAMLLMMAPAPSPARPTITPLFSALVSMGTFSPLLLINSTASYYFLYLRQQIHRSFPTIEPEI
jgi:hypothetical protein